jgi:hypothetical protein
MIDEMRYWNPLGGVEAWRMDPTSRTGVEGQVERRSLQESKVVPAHPSIKVIGKLTRITRKISVPAR